VPASEEHSPAAPAGNSYFVLAFRNYPAALGPETFEARQVRTNLARVQRAQGDLDLAAAR